MDIDRIIDDIRVLAPFVLVRQTESVRERAFVAVASGSEHTATAWLFVGAERRQHTATAPTATEALTLLRADLRQRVDQHRAAMACVLINTQATP